MTYMKLWFTSTFDKSIKYCKAKLFCNTYIWCPQFPNNSIKEIVWKCIKKDMFVALIIGNIVMGKLF